MAFRTSIPWRYGLLLGALGLAHWSGCGGDEASDDSPTASQDDREPNGGSRGDEGSIPKLDAGLPRAPDGGIILPPEVEVALTFDAPQAGKSSVYVPNPTTNRVAVVNASSFAIESLAVGSQPTYAATVPGEDVAIVLNVGSRDAALLRTEGGKSSVTQLEVPHDANAIAIAPGGRHAVIYLNANSATQGARSFQDLTIVALAPTLAPMQQRVQRVSVGFRPRGVQFSADGNRAFVITEDGVSILDFAALDEGPTIAPLVGLGDGLGAGQSVDVQVTPDGAFAIARRAGESNLRLVNLANGEIETLSLGSIAAASTTADAGVPMGMDAGLGDGGVGDGGAQGAQAPELTDLDIAPNGSFALAVLRDLGAIVHIPLPGGFRDPSTLRVRDIRDQIIGSVSIAPSGTLAVAYTSAVEQESITLLDLMSDVAPRPIRLRKSVRAVALSDDGGRVLVLHAPVGTAAMASDDDARIDASEGYSVIDTRSGFVKLQLTSARIRDRDFLITPDRTHLFALQRSDAASVRVLDVVDLGNFQVSSTQLTAPPTAIGFVPQVANDRQGVFVGHASQGGMITFFDANGGAKIQEVAGFEIASRIRQ